MRGTILGLIIMDLVALSIVGRDMNAHPETLAASVWHDIHAVRDPRTVLITMCQVSRTA